MNHENFTGLIVVGTRVHCILYGGRDGVVYEIHGEQRPGSCGTLGGGVVVMGGSAEFDIVWDNGTESRMIPECLVRSSVQWRILEGTATAEDIAAMRGLAILEANRKDDEERAKKEERARMVEQYRTAAEYSHLTKAGQNPKLYGCTLAAANMRAELKKQFPGVKFTVRTSKYSGGDSIDIGWQDGPTTKEVQQITGKYSAGTFDGMTDCYDYHSNAWTDVFGSSRHIFATRSYSADLLKESVREICLEYGYELAPVVEEGRGACIPWGSPEGDQGGDGNHTSIWTLRSLAYARLEKKYPFDTPEAA